MRCKASAAGDDQPSRWSLYTTACLKTVIGGGPGEGKCAEHAYVQSPLRTIRGSSGAASLWHARSCVDSRRDFYRYITGCHAVPTGQHVLTQTCGRTGLERTNNERYEAQRLCATRRSTFYKSSTRRRSFYRSSISEWENTNTTKASHPNEQECPISTKVPDLGPLVRQRTDSSQLFYYM